MKKPQKNPICVVTGPRRDIHRILDTPHVASSPCLAFGTFYAAFSRRVLLGVALFVSAYFTAPPAFAQQTLENPLRFSSLEKFIEGVLQAVVMVALPIIVAFIVYAGFKYIFARGSIDKIKDAHKNFTYVIIGTILILGAWVLATLIGGTVTQLLGN
ncbi:MAG: TrbC/VirB2 family protein [Patescibacteria group bacterium]